MEIIGVWPKTSVKSKNNFISDLHVGIILVLMTFNLIPLVSALIRVWGNMILMIDNLQVTLPVIMASLKLVIFRWKRTAILFALNAMAEDWMELKEDAERNTMKKRAQIARLIAISAYAALLTGYILVVVFPTFGIPFRYITNLTDRGRLLPLQTQYFYNTDKSPQFELTLIIQSMMLFISGTIYMTSDAFLGLLVFHICSQFENFQRRLFNFVMHKNFDKVLRFYIRAHIRLMRFVDNIEDMFNLLMLGSLLHFVIQFCLYWFLLLNVFTNNKIVNVSFTRIGFAIVGVVIWFMNIFLYCGAGEIIAHQCEAVHHAVYDIEWYKLEYKCQRMLILFMMQVNEPIRITAGKIIPLTMTTFCSLVKTSAGYISFLLTKQA